MRYSCKEGTMKLQMQIILGMLYYLLLIYWEILVAIKNFRKQLKPRLTHNYIYNCIPRPKYVYFRIKNYG